MIILWSMTLLSRNAGLYEHSLLIDQPNKMKFNLGSIRDHILVDRDMVKILLMYLFMCNLEMTEFINLYGFRESGLWTI